MEANAFWNARDAWWSSRKKTTTQQKGAPNAVAHEARWDGRAEKYLASFKGLHTAFPGLKLDPKIYEDVADLIRAVAPALVHAMDHHLTALAFNAWRNWPVKTGFSKSRIDLQFQADGDQFIGTVASLAPYTVFIQDHPHRTLLEKPSLAVAQKILVDAGEAIHGR
jgi:hypothetical protein